jgi:hypothetical protein
MKTKNYKKPLIFELLFRNDLVSLTSIMIRSKLNFMKFDYLENYSINKLCFNSLIVKSEFNHNSI